MNRDYKFRVGQRVRMLDEEFIETVWLRGTVIDTSRDLVHILWDGRKEQSDYEKHEYEKIKNLPK